MKNSFEAFEISCKKMLPKGEVTAKSSRFLSFKNPILNNAGIIGYIEIEVDYSDSKIKPYSIRLKASIRNNSFLENGENYEFLTNEISDREINSLLNKLRQNPKYESLYLSTMKSKYW